MRKYNVFLLILLFSIIIMPGCSSTLKEVQALKEEKKYNAAIEKLKEALIETPKDPSLHLEMGVCYALSNDFKRSAYYFVQCIENKDARDSKKHEMMKTMLEYVDKSPEYSVQMKTILFDMLEAKRYEDMWPNIILIIGKIKYAPAEERLKELIFDDNIEVRKNVHIALKEITGDDYIY